MLERWDFEGQVRFLTLEEGGKRTPARMGYFPQLRYPDFGDQGDWIARPVEAFRPDDTAYTEGEEFEPVVRMRFYFLSRELAERVHRPRLTPGLRFHLAEGFQIVADGVVLSTNF